MIQPCTNLQSVQKEPLGGIDMPTIFWLIDCVGWPLQGRLTFHYSQRSDLAHFITVRLIFKGQKIFLLRMNWYI